MSKLKLKKVKKEILEMYSNGKSVNEIAEIVSTKYCKPIAFSLPEHKIPEMHEVEKALSEAVETVFGIEKEFYKAFTISIINSYELDRTVDMFMKRNRRNNIYMLLGGLFYIALAVGMIVGYQHSHPGEDVLPLYYSLLSSTGLAMLVGLGVGLIINKKS